MAFQNCQSNDCSFASVLGPIAIGCMSWDIPTISPGSEPMNEKIVANCLDLLVDGYVHPCETQYTTDILIKISPITFSRWIRFATMHSTSYSSAIIDKIIAKRIKIELDEIRFVNTQKCTLNSNQYSNTI